MKKQKEFLTTNMKSENSIIQGDCRDVLSEVDDNSIDLVITSPPYNVGVDYDEYDDNISLSQYEELLTELFRILNRKVKNTGRVCLNVSLKNKDGIVDTPCLVKDIVKNIGWDLRFEIIWNKGSSESSSAWGSWRSPSSPRPIFNHEYIFVFDVGNDTKDYKKSLRKEKFMQLVKSVWNVSPEVSSDHPAPFPEEIPKRLIKMNSYEEDLVLDPFIGSGTTAVAAEHLNRNWIGIDQSKKYINMSYERLENETKKTFEDKSIFDY